MANARLVFDYLLFYCPYMLNDNCTEINPFTDSDKKNKNKNNDGLPGATLIAIYVAGAVLFGLIFVSSLMYFVKQHAHQRSTTTGEALLGVEPRRTSELRAFRSTGPV